jgi:hypothetical protein
MKQNLGGVDRIFRFGVGFLCLALFFVNDQLVWKVIFGVVAVAGLLTAVTGYCPISALLKVETTGKKE